MGVQLQGIYSVSIASDTNYAYTTPGCPVLPITPGKSGATASAGSAPASPPIACPLTTEATLTSAQLVVTLIVAYKYA
jgi:hypothetical protein